MCMCVCLPLKNTVENMWEVVSYFCASLPIVFRYLPTRTYEHHCSGVRRKLESTHSIFLYANTSWTSFRKLLWRAFRLFSMSITPYSTEHSRYLFSMFSNGHNNNNKCAWKGARIGSKEATKFENECHYEWVHKFYFGGAFATWKFAKILTRAFF